MQTIVVCAAMALAAIAGGCASQPSQTAVEGAAVARTLAPSPAGVWHGVAMRPGVGELRFELRVEEKSPGEFSGTLAAPDLGSSPTQVADIVFDDGDLSFAVPATRAAFVGEWDSSINAWAGEYQHPAANSPITFEAGEASPLPPLPAITGLDGRWEGLLQGVIPTIVRIESDAAGTRGWMDTPSQQVVGAVMRSLTRNGSHVSFSLPGLVFEGQLSTDGNELAGAFSQAGQSLPYTLARTSMSALPVERAVRPQVPRRPFPYKEEHVVLDNSRAPDVRVGCTLTTPAAGVRHAAAVLIGGAGAEDRDMTGVGHKTFFVLADHLTREGVAVLRCDDRDFGKPAENVRTTLVGDFVTDIHAQVEWLRNHADIDPGRIGLVGISLGGVIGPVVAAEDSDIAFVVMLAGLGVPAHEAIAEQRAMMAQSAGASPAEVAEVRARWPRVLQLLAVTLDEAEAQAIVKAELARTPKARPPVYPSDDVAVEMMASTFARDTLAYDPAPVFARIQAPILSVIGELDVQVSARQNSDGLRKLLADHADATVVELPGVNHAFQNAKTGAMDEYAQIEESFAPQALDLISDWVLARVASR